MTKEVERHNDEHGLRLIGWVFSILLGSLVIGSLLAPPLYNLLLWAGRNFGALTQLRDLEFERVVSRSVLVVILVAAPLTIRFSGLKGLHNLGFVKQRGWIKSVFAGFALGCGSILALLLIGWASGAYALQDDAAAVLGRKLIPFLVGALIVGFLEEGVFRGAVFGALRTSYGVWGAAILSSILFSLAHFIRPELPYGVVYGHWYSGLAMFPYMFNKLDFSYHSFPLSLTLFGMGVVLCLLYARTGSVYMIAGLHAGWVWIMRLGVDVFSKTPDRLEWLYGYTQLISKSYFALFTIVIFVVVVALLPRRKEPARGGGDPG